jgi:diguanylate cyclase (GGDEF)-like protein
MINLLLPDQIKELQAVGPTVSIMLDAEPTARLIVDRVSGILDVPTVLVERVRGVWRVAAAVGAGPPLTALSALAPEESHGRQRVRQLRLDDAPWSALLLRASRRRETWLLISGDWTLSEPVLEQLGETLTAALTAVARRSGSRSRREVASYVFARRLARVSDPAVLHQKIIDACARTVGAEKASLALYDEDQRVLTIAATKGYPDVLVRHLQIRPGTGVIGSVYRTGRLLHVDDVRQWTGGLRPRLRYRTPSFVAMPLHAADRVLGVISVADREDGAAFGRGDVRALRSMAQIASLALDRGRAFEVAQARARDAATDPLTGLFNWRHFVGRLEEEAERARRQSGPLSLLMFDIDNFKQVNDKLGHLAGDAVLRVVADVARRSVRLFDICARYGGDEFAILMPGSGSSNSALVAERIREGIEDCRPAGGPWADQLRITASVGVAMFAATADDLIARADQAMYEAKRSGKNQVRVSEAPPAM